ncbi:MAG: Ig-like domain-containing protein [Gammaproteobacteria bacterium]|nr:Ig-like domain-containing protein [Gammaproteobacteria bacterium]
MTGSGLLSDSGVHPSGALRRRLVRPLALLAVTWAAACGGEGGTTEPAPAPQPNRPPVASGSIPAQTMTAGESATVSVGGLFSDPDGDALTFTAISSNAGVASVALSGTNLNITAVSAGSATVTVTARDPAGLSTAASANVTVTEPNRAPVPAVPVAPAQTAIVGDTLNVDMSPFFSDPDGDALTYTATSANASVATVTVTGSVVSAAAVGAGSTTLTVTATDPDGLSGSLSVPLTVEPNRPPEATQDSLRSLSIQERNTEAVNVAQYFTDPNGQALTYTAESDDPAVATVSVSGSTMTVTAVAIGTATVTVTATDPYGLTASLNGTVTVIERVNQAPEAQGTINDISRSAGWSGTLELEGDDVLFVDPDGDDLTYSAESSDPSVAALELTGSLLRVSTLVEGTATGTVTATDPGGLSASVSFGITVLPAAGLIFRDDFDDESSLEDWGFDNAEGEVSEGILRVTNTADSVWGIVGREVDPPITSWEVQARVGRQADTIQTALFFVVTDPGERSTEAFRILIGTRVLDFGDGDTETINYGLQVFFEPEGREEGWYFIGGDGVAFRGISDAINDGPGEFTDMTVRVQDGLFQALAGEELLFSAPTAALSFGDAIAEISQVHLWTFDPALTAPSLLDWIEVNGVPTEGSSATAGANRYRTIAPLDAMDDAGALREVAPRIVGEASPRVVGEGPSRHSLTPSRR